MARAGLLLAATYVTEEVQQALQTNVRAMGGVYRHGLAADTAFLVVGARFTDKYNFAITHGIVVLSPQAFFEVYEAWKAGDDVDVCAQLRARALPPLGGLLICLSSIDAKEKLGFKAIVEAAGGRYDGAFTSTTSVLVSPVDEGRKAAAANKWGIPIVHPRWITDSVKFGHALDPKRYDIRDTDAPMSAPERTAVSEPVPLAAPARPAPSTVLPATRRRRDTLFPAKRERTAVDTRLPSPPIANPLDSALPPVPGAVAPPRARPLLQAVRFRLCGFTHAQRGVLKHTIASHAGVVVDNWLSHEECDYVVVSSVRPALPPAACAPVVTEWALERTLHLSRRALDDTWSRPVWTQPVAGSAGLRVCVSGFDGIEQRHVVELVKLLGCMFMPTLTADREVLVVRTLDARKAPYAQRWSVPVVLADWLWRCAAAGRILPCVPGGAAPAPPKEGAPNTLPRVARVPSAPADGPRPVSRSLASLASLRAARTTSMPTSAELSQEAREDDVRYADDDVLKRAQVLLKLGETPD